MTGLPARAASSATTVPATAPPVNETLRTSGCSTSGGTTSGPKPLTTFTTPSGKPASANRPIIVTIDVEVCSEGFTTTVLPAARAGASFHDANRSGEFHGRMATTTPYGSCSV